MSLTVSLKKNLFQQHQVRPVIHKITFYLQQLNGSNSYCFWRRFYVRVFVNVNVLSGEALLWPRVKREEKIQKNILKATPECLFFALIPGNGNKITRRSRGSAVRPFRKGRPVEYVRKSSWNKSPEPFRRRVKTDASKTAVRVSVVGNRFDFDRPTVGRVKYDFRCRVRQTAT